ncbi:MAG: helix-hairpin-helix domain-containing protein [Mariniphaga sp.]
METLKIKWLKPHPGYAYFAGDLADLEPEAVESLSNSGHVILFPGEDKKEVNTLPEDLPNRDILFENGYTSSEQIAAASNAISGIKGISKKSAELILEFVNTPTV